MARKQAERYGIPQKLLPEPNGTPPRGLSEARASSIQAMVNTLWLYAMEKASDWEQHHAFAALCAQGEERLAMFVASRYIRHLLDRARTQEVSPAKALYRRLRQCLQNHNAVTYRLIGRYAVYACARGHPVDDMKVDETWVPAESYSQWPAPPSFPGSPYGLSREEAVSVACHFWREVVRRLGKPCWVPVRELTRYLLTHVPVAPSQREVLFCELSLEDEEDRNLEAQIPVRADQERALLRQNVPRLAQKLVAGWDERERAVFYAKYALGWNLTDIAKISTHRGPSGAQYLLQQLTRRVQDFCLLWSGLSSFDEDRELLQDFLEEVLNVCKSAWESRRGK
ncbi:hypothetical protein [Desulfosoma caldarium]|nr:hypothetical protein [Desulfosoma caldarium]